MILCQGTELGLGMLGGRYLPPLDVWYTAQTVALMEVRIETVTHVSFHLVRLTQLKPSD